MKPVTFIQYFLPHGNKQRMTIDRPDHIAEQWYQLISLDPPAMFEMEVLNGGMVSMTAERADSEDELLSMELVPNTEEVLTAVDRLITTAYDAVIGR